MARFTLSSQALVSEHSWGFLLAPFSTLLYTTYILFPENLPGNIVFLRRARHAAYTLSENDKY